MTQSNLMEVVLIGLPTANDSEASILWSHSKIKFRTFAFAVES